MSKNTINAAQLNNLLRTAQITVIFEKTDGSERTMNCTLQDRYLPELNAPAATTTLAEASTKFHNYTVWDLDEANWRSFRVSSVKSVIVAGITFSPTKSMLLG